jgi:DNA-directed RNA polymerase subunit M/transcription elongation factor TFIIS
MNPSVKAIVTERLSSLKEVKKEHLEIIIELLTFNAQECYEQISPLPYVLDLTAVTTIECHLTNSLRALKTSMSEYIAILEGPNGDRPSVYLIEGEKIIQTNTKSITKALANKEKAKNALKIEPNWPYPCQKCGKKTVYFESYCSRSADESTTLSFTCLSPSCGCSWTKR